MDLDHAIQSHIDWRLKFRKAMSSHETMDVTIISTDNCCDLGKWLHGNGKKGFGTLASFVDCMKKHAHFHTEAGKVALAVNSKKYAEAEAMLTPGTPYTFASNAVCVAITQLKKDAGI